ncbi:membrane bound O-acyl transferase family-domain-containing protein [Aspergillus pseudonomiae]|uniref:Membrane bound O-acyl transferase family-domain-containing protein n=1 Tax=Aspergillus pseudonomiae TaxID=1506151 RepID=A0A5N6IHC9_9EURO|nr:membrane bound O-acyl transferase family-domain-containing protein [Aspergillus pseudonomiae]KAB8266181.1 membrane bound O-acyl transferase family-domain-containing protein [Aspergillus pseudonomiae]KAE8409046.1 membrane bound O-acyl transferase family-domain-containing protein [Aspergillus pseudonomiae]
MDPASFESWRVPLAQWGLVQLVTGLTVALTTSQSVVRSPAAAIVIALAYSFQSRVAESFADTRAGGPLAAMCWVNVLNAIDMLVLSRVSYEAQVEWEAKRSSGTAAKKANSDSLKSSLFRRLLWSQNIAFNYRRINTPWQISRLPVFDRANPQYVPSRLKFVLQGSVKICIAFLLVHLCTMDPKDPRMAGAIAELSDSKLVLAPWVHGTSARTMLAQAMTTISFGIVCRSSIVGMYSLAGVVLVALGIHDPVDWPPVANSLTEAWSLTRLWGTAWHQVFRTLLVSNADFISFSVLRIPAKSRWACYPRVLFAFTVSGFVHMGMDLAFGVPRDKTGAVWFFCLQALGVMWESVVYSLFGARIERLNPLVRRVLGYVWVGLFLLWATPVWLNPIMLCLYKDGQPAMSPVPIIGGLPL